ncbi:MAG TPA: diguanylate cyclase [Gemmatimonadota bacterium]|nr:diguanylate cyclase [Gemmatimonadota bacterium]
MDESTLRAALDAMDIGIALAAPDGRIEYANAAYAEYVSHPRSSIEGASIFGAGCPCPALVSHEAEWATSEGIAVTGDSPQGMSIDVVARPISPGARLRLVVVRRGFVRSAQRHGLSDEIVEDLQSFLAELTGHPAEPDALIAPISLLMLGIRDLDELRERLGDEMIERIHREVAQALVLQKRKADIISRFGEGQFLVLAPETPRHGAAMLAERIRARVESIDFESDGRSIPISLVTWAAEYRPDLDGPIREAVERGSEAVSGRAIEPIV